MAKKEGHPAWFKMFWHQKALIDSLPDAKVGQALKAAYQYFEDGTVPKMTPLAFTLFSSIKPYVDESTCWKSRREKLPNSYHAPKYQNSTVLKSFKNHRKTR